MLNNKQFWNLWNIPNKIKVFIFPLSLLFPNGIRFQKINWKYVKKII